eukprot:m.274423 g.274423  ORF g.274423 m.274423 type:complete len:76 (+) comp69375_c0_seq1:312-539(+)
MQRMSWFLRGWLISLEFITAPKRLLSWSVLTSYLHFVDSLGVFHESKPWKCEEYQGYNLAPDLLGFLCACGRYPE